jgi:N-acetylneuraminate synthase
MNVLMDADVAIVLMQCNTNYEGSIDNIAHVNLGVLRQYAERYPGVTLGLSDHTPGHVTVLGAVALGARAVEKHFTDDTSRVGPDHGFSMDPTTWREMVEATRMLEAAMGTGLKRVEDNESQTIVLQRRCVRLARDISAGTVITREDLEVLRPAPREAVPAHLVHTVVGRTAARDMVSGEHVSESDLA